MVTRSVFPACLLSIFLYLTLAGCTDPASIPAVPLHYTYVPMVLNFQAETAKSPIGTRLVWLTWQFDTTSTNIRSWDVYRNSIDTIKGNYAPLGLVSKPSRGYPYFIDSTCGAPFLNIPAPDSLDIYYYIVPNGQLRSYIGKPSDIVHVVMYK